MMLDREWLDIRKKKEWVGFREKAEDNLFYVNIQC